MKKVFNILIITLIALASCKKDKDFSGVNVVLKNVSVSTGVADMTYYAEYSYPANLKAVTMLLSENSSMSDARTVECDAGYMTIKATVKYLNSGTKYYYKLKYDTGFGILESEVKSFATECVLPTVTTGSITNVTQSSATCGGNVTSDGGATVTVRGVCWSTSQNPTINDAHNASGSGTGSYTVDMPALTANTIYYVRAYAKNSAGIGYGEQKSFKTQGGGGSIGGHDYVDLGLPSGLLWATCNVGASSPEDYGDYFAWGEIEPYYSDGHSQDNPCTNWRNMTTGAGSSEYGTDYSSSMFTSKITIYR